MVDVLVLRDACENDRFLTEMMSKNNYLEAAKSVAIGLTTFP